MATKRGRSLSLTDNEPSAKRGKNECTNVSPQLQANDSNEIPALVTCTTSSDSTVSNATMHNLPLAEANAESEAPMVRINEVQTDILSAGVQDQEQSDKMVVPVPLKGKIVVAPEFAMVHDSWEAFDVALKAHGKRTYQLYVIRSTTSVKRRNIKIGESMGRGDVCSTVGTLQRVSIQQDVSVDHELNPSAEKTLIPEQYQWYSKSLKCTHGWKNRYRGTGKRGSGVVRSTSCPAKMCVTLQHRGSGPDDWKVVVTKHVRTHNHQLSRELYLYYTENRRIYDPDLLAVAGETLATKLSVDFENATFPSLIDQAYPRPDFSRMLISSEDQGQQQQASSMVYMMSDSSSATGLTDCHTDKQVMPLSDSTACVSQSQTTLTSVPSLNTMILTPGTLPPSAMDGGGFCVPRVAVKIHACWTVFHDYVAQYAFDTSQVFRTRSTVSVAARNAKLLASISTKTGSDHASHAKNARTGPTSRLIPTECKWFSKLLICTHGWKRRVRNESSQISKPESGPCPAMLLARMERNVNGNWQVVINRQVVEHNHKLGRQVDETSATHHEPFSEIAGMLPPAQLFPSTSMPQTSNGDHPIVTETQTISPECHVDESQSASSHQCDIVVRVPRIQSMFSSWDDFHASLKLYSDATYQLYRTRTTSSVKGRNKKIAQMEDKSEDKDADNDTERNFHTALNGGNAARRIPDSWRWYSKTLTCTHGWKERHRGTGKRNAHGVRSTECPVKICATVQYLPPSSRLETDTGLCERDDESCWRVVVTKHVVDHNHNLSRELYQHYCENRRIYDPELLTVDTSNSSTVITRKTGSSGFNEQGGSTAEATKSFDIQFIGKQLPPQSVLSMQMAEAVSQAQLFDVSSNQPSTFEMSSAPASLVSVSTAQPTIPSVVLLPSSSTSSTLSDRAQALQEEMLQQQKQQLNAQQQSTLSALVNATIGNVDQASEGSQSLASQASGAVTAATLVPFNNAGMTMSGALPPTGLNVISRACRVHGSSLGTKGGTMGTTDAQAPPCTCFRMARGSDYVTIVPASEPLGRTEPNGSADQDSIGFTETDGVWQPSSKFEITKATTESGDTIWRVPRIRRRYPTWAIFHKYLDEYSTTTFQLYRVRTTYSVRSRNIRLRQLAASRGLTVREGGEEDAIETEPRGDHGISRAHLVPEEYEWYSKTFLCTHGWKRRSRGSGQRMSHNVRATECPAKVCATLQRTDDTNNWSVVVTKHLAEHNHELSEALYQLYSEVRRVRDPAVLAQAEQVWRAGATRRRVFEFLKEQSPNQTILMKDVHNLVQRWQTQERRPRQEVGLDDQEGQPPQPKSVGSSSHDHASVSWL